MSSRPEDVSSGPEDVPSRTGYFFCSIGSPLAHSGSESISSGPEGVSSEPEGVPLAQNMHEEEPTIKKILYGTSEIFLRNFFVSKGDPQENALKAEPSWP